MIFFVLWAQRLSLPAVCHWSILRRKDIKAIKKMILSAYVLMSKNKNLMQLDFCCEQLKR